MTCRPAGVNIGYPGLTSRSWPIVELSDKMGTEDVPSGRKIRDLQLEWPIFIRFTIRVSVGLEYHDFGYGKTFVICVPETDEYLYSTNFQ